MLQGRGTAAPGHRGTEQARHLTFSDFPSLVEPNDVVVINDSRVFPARLIAQRSGGGAAEVLLVRRQDERWIALVKPGSRIRAGARLAIGGSDAVHVLEHLPTGERMVRLEGEGGDDAILARRGHVPLPPYIRRADTPDDRERYQTVYAREPGSVAAPTAGLHFTDAVLAAMKSRGATIAPVTLHVGPGTFRPVEEPDPARHRMDAEAYALPEDTAAAVAAARRAGGRVWAVGTTALRVLETCATGERTVRAGDGRTSLFVLPGFTFRVVDCLLTNFHLPRSTLLMLVCAFAGTEQVLDAYREAVRLKYRFYSYGDAMAVIGV